MVASSFWTVAIVPGLINAIGNIFADVMSTFNASRTEASLVQSVMLGVILGSGTLLSFDTIMLGPLQKKTIQVHCLSVKFLCVSVVKW